MGGVKHVGMGDKIGQEMGVEYELLCVKVAKARAVAWMWREHARWHGCGGGRVHSIHE